MYKKILIILLIIMSVTIFYKKSHYKGNTIPSLVEVEVYQIQPINVLLSFKYPGRVDSYKKVDVKAQTNGILMKQIYKEGQYVEAGDILFNIDSGIYEANLNKAESAFTNAQANFTQVEAIWYRSDQLYKNKMISVQDHDTAFLNYNQAKNQVVNAQADVLLAKINLSYTNIVSPINGITSEKKVSEGNLINIGDTLTTVTQSNPTYINFSYPESDFHLQKKLISQQKISEINGSKVQISIENDVILSELGIIDYVDTNIDPSTATVTARVAFSNVDNILTAGQFVRVEMQDTIMKDAIVIPDSVVMQDSNDTIVYCVDDNHDVFAKKITLGPITEKGRIVYAGLEKDDNIITTNILKLQIGQKVKIL